MTKRNILSLLILILAVWQIHAESRTVRPIEVELGTGITVPIDSKYDNADRNIGPMFNLSARYNITNTPWACGLFINIDWADWNWGGSYSQYHRTGSIGVLGEYNFRQGHKINPFAGLGIGLGMNQIPSSIETTHNTATFIPRVGVELWYWLRVNAYVQVSRKSYNVFGLSLGITIGGRPKKAQ